MLADIYRVVYQNPFQFFAENDFLSPAKRFNPKWTRQMSLPLPRRERNIFPKFLHIYFVPSRVTKKPFFTPFWKKFLHLSRTFRPNFERYVPGIDVNVVPRPWNCSFFRTISTKKKKVKNRKSSIPLFIDERISRVRLPPIQCEIPFEPKGVDFSLFSYNNNNRLEKLQGEERRGNESAEGSKNDWTVSSIWGQLSDNAYVPMKQTLEFGSYSQAGRRQGLENFSGIGRGGLVCYVRRTILDEEGSWILNAWATSSILPFGQRGREKSAIREERSPRPSCRNKSERMRDKAYANRWTSKVRGGRENIDGINSIPR